ncbi:hypothetical protein AMOR_51310 [Anaeromyxobacter oryzae]|uniref:Lipopolysaccharide assembly protein A domain-containing protein n=1 Tax=Anaeromyxobacter oryzae TaxID=2918170 RepID=A0ABM7X2W2_9BACT|nr:hypothetical protein AMOR_51310 [Anaeromyxobacter oryzae]
MGPVEILFALAVLLPFGLGAWALAITAYARAREASRRVAALEARLAALERAARDRGPGQG